MMIADIPHEGWTDAAGWHDPDTVVTHALAEFIDFGDVDKTGWQHVDDLGLGAHVYIYPSGAVVQSIIFGKPGRHAKGHNQNTIGIELIVGGVYTYQTFVNRLKEDWVTDAQYQALEDMLFHIQKVCRNVKYITTHSKLDPERKVDPGAGFDPNRIVLPELMIANF